MLGIGFVFWGMSVNTAVYWNIFECDEVELGNVLLDGIRCEQIHVRVNIFLLKLQGSILDGIISYFIKIFNLSYSC